MATTTIAGGNILKVTKGNGDVIWLPNPAHDKMEVAVQDVDYDSGRTADGKMYRDRKRGGTTAVRKVSCTFPPLSPANLASTLQAINEAFFTLEYPDPYTGQRRSGTFYCGDRTAPMYSLISGVWQWKELTVNFVER